MVTGARWLWGVWIKNRFQVEGMRYGPPSPIQPLRSYWPSFQPVTPKHNAVRDVTDEVMGGLGNSLMITVGMQTPIWWPQNIWTRIHSNISNWLVVNSQILNTRFCLRFFWGGHSISPTTEYADQSIYPYRDTWIWLSMMYVIFYSLFWICYVWNEYPTRSLGWTL